jgi:putative ABC transport system permease protein
MFRNYIKTAWRGLKRGKLFSFINVTGLSIGMGVAMIIGMWVWDELSFDKHFKNFDRLGQVWQFVKFDVEKASYNSVPIPLAEELRTKYPGIEATAVTTYNRNVILGTGDKKLMKQGMFAEAGLPAMLSLQMQNGSLHSLTDMNSILVAESLVKALFATEDPIDKLISIDNKTTVRVAGVYKDFPDNTSFKDVSFFASWQLFMSMDGYAKRASTEWDENSFQVFVQLKEGVEFGKISAAIKDIRMKREDPPAYKPEFFIHPMSKWHLEGDFKNGANVGGLIQLVKLFGFAGIFVLLLACINFMNLSTARSEKRAREVGIRKTIGSERRQLIYQFFTESLLLATLSFVFSLVLVQLALPFFNEIAGKKMNIPWSNLDFWWLSIGFCAVTGLVAGSYPALYLSSFQPIKVLKGTFRSGRSAGLPRKAMLVFQFSVSIMLIIGTIIVYRQLQFAKDRPAGYDKDRLVEVNIMTPELKKNYEILRSELLNSGYVVNVSRSAGSVTNDYGGTVAVGWKGKSPDTRPLFISNMITAGYGKTVGWKVLAGRDFSEKFATDSLGLIINEAAMKLMGFSNPLNETVRLSGKEYQVIGVVADMIKFSPFDHVKPSLFTLNMPATNTINIRIASTVPVGTALAKMGTIFKKYNPASPFDYKFVDTEYATKFANEVKISKLAGFFAALAIFISCMGIFGLATYVAEQRTREIGLRKVLGASMGSVWQLMSKEFVVLVLISMFIAAPLAGYFMSSWLENYVYRTTIAWWIFGLTGCLILFLTLVMISYQSIKVALMNPIKTLRAE